MDDIFKSKDEILREEKINNLFKSAGSIEDLKEKTSAVVPESGKIMAEEPENNNWKILANILLVLLFLGLAAAAGYFFWQYKKIASDSQAASAEAEIIAEKVRILAELPQDTPVLATITNQDQITKQSFFPQAVEGDKILVYIQSKRAFLYRPSSNQVIEAAALISGKSLESDTDTVAAGSGVAENAEKTPEKIETKVKVDVLNGTEIKGLAKETADKLSGTENVELAKIGNAEKSTYTKILVVDVSGKNGTAAKIIAKILSGEVGALPTGENKGTADILVIAGK